MSEMNEDREQKFKRMVDMAWQLKTRGAFDAVIEMARQMGHTDGYKECAADVFKRLAAPKAADAANAFDGVTK